MTDLRKKRIWSVGDFAAFTSLSHKAALHRLKKYDATLGGKLLTFVGGPTGYTFQPALLSRVLSEVGLGGLFDSIESLEMRVSDVEDKLGDLHESTRRLAVQTGSNTRDIAGMKRKRAA